MHSNFSSRMFVTAAGAALLALPIALASIRPAQAQSTEYTSQGDFFGAVYSDPAITSATTVTFNGVPVNPALDYTNEGTSFSLDGLGFSTDAGSMLDVISPNRPGYSYGTGNTLGAFANTSGLNSTISVALPGSTYAFGFDLGDVFASPSFVVTVNGVPTLVTGGQTIDEGGNGFNFVGFVSSAPITSLTLTGPPNEVTDATFDNFTYGVSSMSPAPAPEAGTSASLGLMLSAGIGALVAGGRKRRAGRPA